MEALEDRCTPAGFSITVNTELDETNVPTTTSLREAITASNADQTPGQHRIEFAPSMFGKTIVLGAAGDMLPTLTKETYINGLGASNLTVQRDTMGGNFRLFEVNTNTTVTIYGLTLKYGAGGSGGGGAIKSYGNLTVTSCVIQENTATNGNGGGINAASGALDVNSSSVNGNSAEKGGGIYLSTGVPMNMGSSTVGLNSASERGGGIFALGGGSPSVNLGNSYVTGNTVADNSLAAGGGIWFAGGTLTLSNGTHVQNNVVQGTNGKGGGVYLSSGTINLFGATFGDNSAANGKGLYRVTGTTINIGPNGVDWGNDGQPVVGP